MTILLATLKQIFTNRASLIMAATATLSAMTTMFLTGNLLHLSINARIFAAMFATFFHFYAFGTTKWQRCVHLLILACSTLLALTLINYSNAYLPYYFAFIFMMVIVFVYLSLPHYCSVAPATPIFGVIFILINVLLNPTMLPSRVISANLEIAAAVFFAAVTTIFYIIILPLSKSISLPRDRSGYIIKKALRVTITVALALSFSHIFHLYRSIWAAIATVTIAQSSLGGTIKRGIERIVGTLGGVVAGIIFGHIFFQHYYSTMLLAYLFGFLGFLFLRQNFSIGLGFLTLILSVCFFLVKITGVSLTAFLLARLSDTMVGVLIGVLGEVLIFPRSLLKDIQFHFGVALIQMANYCQKHSLNKDVATTQLVTTEKNFQALDIAIKNFNYEPLVIFSKRYRQLKLLRQQLLLISLLLPDACNSLWQQKNDYKEILDRLADIWHAWGVLILRQMQTELSVRLPIYLREIVMIKIELSSLHEDKDETAHNLRQLATQSEIALLRNQKLLSSSRWTPYWRSE